jgi:ankyrin repeat protein
LAFNENAGFLVVSIRPSWTPFRKSFAPKPPPPSLRPVVSDMEAYLKACQEGDLSEIRWFLKYYPNDADVHRGKKTALMYAAEAGRTAVVEFLLGSGADITAKDGDGNTALIWACRSGKAETVALLLQGGAQVNAKNSNGDTALHIAAVEGDCETITLLLGNKAVLDARAEMDETPLCCAIRNGRADAVRLLLDRGASLKVKIDDARLLDLSPDVTGPEIYRMLQEEPARREAQVEAAISGGVIDGMKVSKPMKLRRRT